MSRPSLEEIDKIPVEIIQSFRKTGTSMGISPMLQEYIMQLDRAVEIHNVEHEHNVARAARRLMEQYPQLSLNTAKSRIFDAISYFHLNNTVKSEAWSNYYADRMEDLAQLAIAKDNHTEARRCFERAMEYRKQASQVGIDPEQMRPHVFLVSPEVDADLLGMKKHDLKQLWKETSDFIDSIPLTPHERASAKRDASLALNRTEDADAEIID